jgi:hypothetical protein
MADRIRAAGVSATPPAAPAVSLPQGYPTDEVSGTTPGTIITAWWLHMLTEEIRNCIVAGGVTPSVEATNQLAQAVQNLVTGAAEKPVVCLADDRIQGAHGGAFTSGSWVTRQIAEVSDVAGLATVAANVITLEPGVYEVDIRAPGYYCGAHQARLYDVTGAAVAIVGTSEYTNPGQEAQVTWSVVSGRIAVLSQRQYRIEHRCGTTRADDGLGRAANLGPERYTIAVFRRLAASA